MTWILIMMFLSKDGVYGITQIEGFARETQCAEAGKKIFHAHSQSESKNFAYVNFTCVKKGA